MTILAILVSVLSILVTVLICWQVYNLIELKNFKKELNSIVNNSITESIKDYNHTISAIIHQIEGIFHMGLPEKDVQIALESFINAISDLNGAKNKEPLDGIVSYIEDLVTENTNLIKLSNNTKKRYISECQKCLESKKLVELLGKLNISQNQSNVNGDNIQGLIVDVNKDENNKN